jgi:predicted Zn-dependent protease
MPDPASITIVPLGTVDLTEVEAAARRAAKALGLSLEIARPVLLPTGHYDAARSQSVAAKVVLAVPATIVPSSVRAAPGTTADPTATRAAALSPAESWGSRVHGPATSAAAPAGREAPKAPPPPVKIGVTDTDLFTDRRDFVFVHADPAARRAVVSTKRLKEAFWKRKSDPPRQQNRLVREIIGAVALAAGAAPCENPDCAASSAKSPLEIDRKVDQLCPACDRKVRGGALKP